MKQQINFRASELTASQLEKLSNWWGTSQTETITVIVDRVYQQESENRGMSAQQAKQQYPVGKEIDWFHPADMCRVKVTVTGYESTQGKPLTVNVKGEDFTDGASAGRLETDGSGLK